MRRKQHMQIGAFIGGAAYIGYYLYRKEQNADHEFNGLAFVGSVLAGMAGGRLPDLIEPANDPNHRKFWHSLTCAGVLNTGYGFLPAPLKAAALPLLAGYNSHLAADSISSPLPWI
jgi:membrane-bound metal-dependent hydrolase YbcI (DUF457 family)